MRDIDDPNHPGWVLWKRVRVRSREDYEAFQAMDAAAGLPPLPPYEPLPEIPDPGHLDRIVAIEEERQQRARTFRYWEIRWDGSDPRVIAERQGTGELGGAVLFDAGISGQWILDEQTLEDIRHYEAMENHYTTQEVSRGRAEQIAAERGLVLPSVERLLEICEQRIGAMFGGSATPEELAERRRLMG